MKKTLAILAFATALISNPAFSQDTTPTTDVTPAIKTTREEFRQKMREERAARREKRRQEKQELKERIRKEEDEIKSSGLESGKNESAAMRAHKHEKRQELRKRNKELYEADKESRQKRRRHINDKGRDIHN